VHVNGVLPTGNIDPDAGVQLLEIGDTPPAVSGLNVTETAEPFVELAVGTGHVIVNTGDADDVVPETSIEGSPSTPDSL